MADMSNAEAAEILDEKAEAWEESQNIFASIWDSDMKQTALKYKTALRMGAAALRGWVKTEDRLPAEADTGDDGKILCVTVGVFGGTVILPVFWGIVAEHPERYPYWMPIPPLPEVEE